MSLSNSDVRIEAIDKSFIITSGENFNTPFFTFKERDSVCYLPSTAIGWIFYIPFTLGLGLPYLAYCAASNKLPYDDPMIPDNYPSGAYYAKYSASWAIKNGGKGVQINRGDKTYAGVLMIFPILEEAKGPVTRSYEINIPSSSFADAGGGKIAVVYEPYDTTSGNYKNYRAWILWLSDKAIN